MQQSIIGFLLICCFIGIGLVPKIFSQETKIPSERNPFFKAGEGVLSFKVKGLSQEIGPLKLEATMLSGKNKMALISGRILKEGETFEGREVVTIKRDRVFVKDAGKMVVLKLSKLTEAKSHE